MKRFFSFFALTLLMSTMLSSCFLFRGGHELCPAYGQLEDVQEEDAKAKVLSGTEFEAEQRS